MINIYRVVLTDTLFGCPFAPNKRPFLTFLSSLANLAGTEDTNSSNREIAAMNNAVNLDIAKKNNEMSWQQFNSNMNWLREQFYKQREYALSDRAYNEPSRIVERLLRAGVNPSSYFGSGSQSTNPVSSVGAPSQSNFATPEMRAPQAVWNNPFDFSGFFDEITQLKQGKLMDAERDKTENEAQREKANAMTQLMTNLMQLRKTFVDTEESLSRRDLNKEQRNMLVKQREDLENRIDLFMKTLGDQVESFSLQNQRVKREIEHDVARQGMEERQLQINADLARSGITLNQAQEALALSQGGKTYAEKVGIEFSNEVKAAADLVASRKTELDAAMLRYGASKLAGPILASPEYKQYKAALKEYHKKLMYADKRLSRKSNLLH